MKDASVLVHILVDPPAATKLPASGWTALLSIARAERLIGTLADRLAGLALPRPVMAALAEAREQTAFSHTQALWEVEMARRALAPQNIPLILLKGSAFAFAGLPAAAGRLIGDLDILVARDRIDTAEAALHAAGWEWLKDDRYTDSYYRRWMHELPPLVHRDRGAMIDVHHTILPLTARRTPDADALVADSIEVAPGVRMLAPADMIVHAATHLLADGDLAGGLRNLWDIDRLLRPFSADADFWPALAARAARHEVGDAVALALRLSRWLYATPVDPGVAGPAKASDTIFLRRLLARDGWGRETRMLTRLGFYIRSHWMRMPPAMLARHLWIKARG